MPKKLHDCVDKVKGKPGVDNPCAVCQAAIVRRMAERNVKAKKK